MQFDPQKFGNLPNGTSSHFLNGWGDSILFLHLGDWNAPEELFAVRKPDWDFVRQKQNEGWNLSISVHSFPNGIVNMNLMAYRRLVFSIPRPNTLDQIPFDWVNQIPRFPLTPQQVLLSRSHFEIVFEVEPITNPQQIRQAFRHEQRLTQKWGAAPQTELHRVVPLPMTYEFSGTKAPHLCQLLWNEPIPAYQFADLIRFLA